MTKLVQHIEELRARLAETSTTEQSLVKNLGDSLTYIDQLLTQEIRKVASEHENRRAVIFNELQALACSIGVFHPPQEVGALPQSNDGAYYSSVGDWRQATMNLNYQDQAEYQNGKGKH